MEKVDIVIPTYNAVHWLEQCLRSIKRYALDSINKVIVVDDNSTEGLQISSVCRKYEFVDLYINPKENNRGFGSSCNFGFTLTTTPRVLFLNTDCLLTPNTVVKLQSAFMLSDVVLACPLSNNSPDLTLPMPPGLNYMLINEMLESYCRDLAASDYILEACTIVGNCLMVSRDFFKSVQGFSEEWGIGYGEETDLHMKAFAQGLKGVAVINSYVYHYGSGSFNAEVDIENHKLKNHALFMSKWRESYKLLESQTSGSKIIEKAHSYLCRRTD